ncbi:transcriptional regulator family: GCN5-like 1 [Penicillium lagena]|uniref:transcriptional regulator family: GCN5-like 1 n=1 Tax=Penicillium lagena TaxID=94218 RepID=UPI002540E08B|nr:transcriptional regulator family: GCN5-like 1 [Penicillium lagena]KAJ5613208.1 transcriptional regulator family: GCN5-like 1 [Penicillium lagena]
MSTDQQPSSSTLPPNTQPVPDTHSQPQPQPDSSPSQEQQQKEEALAAFTATLHSVGTTLELPLRSRAALIESNAVALERQEAELAGHTAQLARQNEQWAGLAEDARKGLKEIGDVQNWAEVIERDLLVLEEMVGVVERRQQEEDVEMETGSEDGRGDGERRVNGISILGEHEEDPKKKIDGRKRGWWTWW